MSQPSTKKLLFTEFSLMAKAVSNPTRLEMLDYLAQGECTVEFLAQKCGQKIGNISQHLRLLSQTGLVTQRRQGTFIHYRGTAAAEKLVESLASAAAEASPQVREITRLYFHGKDDLFIKSNVELLAAVKRGEILLIDVRPPDEFENGHIAGARSVPLKKLLSEVKALPKNKEIVAYCRGPWCVLAVEAVQLLKKSGLNASRLEDGFPQWRAKKLPIAV
jgi:rhodanese-related sulfurtransferase/DNA-binding MarR family transcriptional regulator